MAAIPKIFAQLEARFDAGGYDPLDALAFAITSQLAYKPRTMVLKVLRHWGFRDAAFIDVSKGGDIDTQGLIASNGRVILVAFRGSESIAEDWLTNAQFVTDPGPFRGTKVHEGFQDALYPAVMQLSLHVSEMGPLPIWVTGHSLGGALANIFSAMLLEHGLPLAGLYTYGSPRVGDKKFDAAMARAFRAHGIHHHRVVNDGDAVPHVPPEPWFSHAGERRLLGADGVSVDIGVWKRFKAEMADFFSVIRRPIRLVDVHRLMPPDGYIPALRRQLPKPTRRA